MGAKKGKKINGKQVGENTQGLANKDGKINNDIANKAKEVAENPKDSVIKSVDQNSKFEIDIEDIIILGLKAPGIKINRAQFLKEELLKKYSQDVIDSVIAKTPAQAKIPSIELNKIADEVIKYEKNCVSAIAAALGMPGGLKMADAIPTDIVQYYGYMLRTAQKLLYLYGFPEIDTEEIEQNFDSETMNILILCLGAMYGVAGANNAIKILAKAFAEGAEKKLIKDALAKGAIYPIIKIIIQWFNVNLTKKILSETSKQEIPVAGGTIGGGINFFAFKSSCERLKTTLQDTLLSNPNHKISGEESIVII